MATTKQSEIAMWRREERDRVGKESVAKSHSSLRPFWFGTKMRRGSFNRSSAKSSKWQHVAHVALAKKFVQCKREMNSQTEGERDKERVGKFEEFQWENFDMLEMGQLGKLICGNFDSTEIRNFPQRLQKLSITECDVLTITG